ncbi:MAG TPA: radical SAM family heme chaperone HemW [Gemmatimonadaceae bacterium]
MPASHLYVHVPFCARRCIYCDFSIAVRHVVPVSDYLDGIRRELKGFVSSVTDLREDYSWRLNTLYLGGGTPSKLGGNGIAALVDVVTDCAYLAPDAEVTIEANPEDVTPQALEAWTEAGINRLSLGAQSFHDPVLTWMHRTHDSKQIGEAVRLARAAGIYNISLDLIFALPAGIERSWSDDLDAALGLEPQHLSLYGLTIEAATPLQRWTDRQRISPAGEDRYADEFLLAHERMSARGFTHYEVSNFALPGRESRHNSAYWSGVPYLGIGPAAHSFDGERRRWNVKSYAEWLRLVRSGDSAVEGHELLDSKNMASELVYLGLRTRDGYTIGPSGATDRAVAERWARAGWAVIDGDLVRLNPEGWLRLDTLAAGLTGH